MTPFEKYQSLTQEVLAATLARGGTPGGTRILPVTKTVGAEVIRALYDSGLREFGENREPVLAAKAEALPRDICWHFIGPLQSNKVRKVVKYARVIHSVESLDLLRRIERIAGEEGKHPLILLEVSISGEASKGGCTPGDALAIASEAVKCKNLTMIGLMTMAPLDADETAQTEVFSGLRDLRDKLEAATGARFPELSMGMTRDWPRALECGSTILRLGTVLFSDGV